MPRTESDKVHISALNIFFACSRIALSSFGAPLFWARRELIERQRWLTEREFTDLLAIGQILPGANVLNLLVMFGHRSAGWKGAVAAIAGFFGWPFFIVIGLGVLYQTYAALPLVQPALIGMSAVAAGMLLGSSVKMAAVLPRHWRPWLCGTLAFVGVGILRWPLLMVLGVLAPYAIWAAWKEKDR
jgi:chromate transporter